MLRSIRIRVGGPLAGQDDGGGQTQEGGLPHLAERLNILFARIPQRGATQPYTNDRAADELNVAGISVTGTYLSQLRSGKRSNPSARLLAGIADLFEVPIGYFFDADQAAKIEEQLDALAALRSSGVRAILARTAGVSEAGIANLSAALEHIRHVERLNDEN